MHIRKVRCIVRTALNIDESLIDEASRMTGIKEKTAFVEHQEVLAFIERHELMGKGLGY